MVTSFLLYISIVDYEFLHYVEAYPNQIIPNICSIDKLSCFSDCEFFEAGG